MSQNYTAKRTYLSDSESLIQVQSARCRYQVCIEQDEVVLLGPGVEERGDFPTMEGKLDDEDFSIFVVMLFENGLWPEE